MASIERLKQTRVKLIRYTKTRCLLDRHNPCVEQPFFEIQVPHFRGLAQWYVMVAQMRFSHDDGTREQKQHSCSIIK